MGALMILRIQFKEKKFMKSFLKKYEPIILVEEETQSDFHAWRGLWRPNTLICFMGFMGYAEPIKIKKELKGKIKYFDWIPINDLNSRWNKDEEAKEE
jgi:hypothetical protein